MITITSLWSPAAEGKLETCFATFHSVLKWAWVETRCTQLSCRLVLFRNECLFWTDCYYFETIVIIVKWVLVDYAVFGKDILLLIFLKSALSSNFNFSRRVNPNVGLSANTFPPFHSSYCHATNWSELYRCGRTTKVPDYVGFVPQQSTENISDLSIDNIGFCLQVCTKP